MSGTRPIAQLPQHIGAQVRVAGWVTHVRSSGKVRFLALRDGSGDLQVVARAPDAPDSLLAQMASLTQETSVVVAGLVRGDPRSPGGVELAATEVTVVGSSDGYPIAPKEHGVDFLMDHRHLWVRSSRQTAALRLRARIVHALRAFLDDHGFVLTDPPILTPAAAEGTSTLFGVDYFGEPAFLSQSGQLYMEATAMALGRVYSFGPTFRAEKSKTRRHLTEFWMVEPEMAFCEFEENLAWQERLVAYVVADVLAHRRAELVALGRDTTALERVEVPFPRIAYDEAVERLAAAGFAVAWGDDFGSPEETALAGMFDRPVFVHRFPARQKAFYMQPDPARPEVALAADLLAPEGYGEIVGGSQRIHDVELLTARLVEHGLDPDAYSWYLDLRRYGSVPHSGFGLGLERLVAWIGGLEHVRETIPFPRTLNRVWP
ncbi:MAG: asparagine--tRNA ligase [Thermaerobacter sp.]|nr:asparagine--tRNA ligase [Thermaerobacter sp.]